MELLNRRQEAALIALLEKGSVQEAATACNLSEVTLWRYMQDPYFLARYRAAPTARIAAARHPQPGRAGASGVRRRAPEVRMRHMSTSVAAASRSFRAPEATVLT